MSEKKMKKKRVPKLPKPKFPTLGKPEEPQFKGQEPPDAPHVSCEGEIYIPPKENPNIKAPEGDSIRIMIGIPILAWTHEFAESFLKFWTEICLMQQEEKRHIQVGYTFMYRKPVNIAEKQLVDLARYNKCTHILFMDDDIYDIHLTDLMKLIDADKDVIGGVMYASKFPYAMCVFRRYDDKKQVIDMPSDNSMYRLYEVPCQCKKCNLGLSHWDAEFCPKCGEPQSNLLQKADLIPFCFTLMKLSIFDKIKEPWFYCSDIYPTDSWFGDRCIEAGIQEWAHMGVRLNHAGCNDLTRPFLIQKGLEEAKAKQAGIVNLTQEDMARHEVMLHNKMKEAETKIKPTLEVVSGKPQAAPKQAAPAKLPEPAPAA